jgi:hypothetical protein
LKYRERIVAVSVGSFSGYIRVVKPVSAIKGMLDSIVYRAGYYDTKADIEW